MAESFIIPDGPTLLEGVSVLSIDHLDFFAYNAANSYIIPELIDVGRFNAALAKMLTYIPLYAARVSYGENGCAPWHLTLPSKGIPVTVLESDETEIVPIGAVKIVLDPTAPLASILTKFPKLGLTSIGITRWHQIGSDYVASRFIRTLSQFYEGIAFGEPELVYKAAKTTCLKGIDTSAVEAYYPSGSAHPQLVAQPPSVRIDFHLSAAQVQQLHGTIHAQGGENANFLTRQDCIVALIAVATNAADATNVPIHTIDTVLDVRGVGDIPKELAFNEFTFAPTDRITPAVGNDYYTYAAAVRQSIMCGRTPQFLAALTDLQAERAAEAINRGEVTDLASPPGRILCNSTLRLDEIMRPEIHFGHPGKTRSYVGTVPFVRHLKLARPSPAFSGDGMRTSRLDITEVTLFFAPLVRERFIKEIDMRLQALNAEGAVEWFGMDV
ncbi:hypothetical protein C8J57DRAFT_1244481 [Mycena rebaudengoi]|nr:hypothetical protein C8J57DRAFT_1244481 [Mycena rebaudengoi]